MSDIPVKKDAAVKVVGRKHYVKVIPSSEKDDFISNRDLEMDARAREAVKTAVSKAEFCKKPVARYDKVSKKAYIEYSDGEKKYVN